MTKDCSNYKGILLLRIILKIHESVLSSRLSDKKIIWRSEIERKYKNYSRKYCQGAVRDQVLLTLLYYLLN